MFAKYNLKLEPHSLNYNDSFRDMGHRMITLQKNIIHNSLLPYLAPDGSLNADSIEEDWFPGIDAHVFLSHSHNDLEDVIRLAGFLGINYGITSFVDSLVWGYSNDLLKQIDDKYCVQTVKPNGGHTYDYDLRNQSTAHVHMILQGALAKMIDRAECLIFVNTPNSIAVGDIGNENETSSPWIYNELLMANTFPPRRPDYYNILKSEREDSIFEHSALEVKYKVNLEGFVDIDISDFSSAALKAANRTPRKVLDQLYLDTGLIIPRNIRG